MSAEDLPSYQAQLRGDLQGLRLAVTAARFPAAPAAAAFAAAGPRPGQHPPHRYNLRSGSGLAAGVASTAAACAAGLFQSAARRPVGAAPAADRGHLLSAAPGDDLGHLLPPRGGGLGQPALAGVGMQAMQLQPPHPLCFPGLPPRHPGPAAGRPVATNAPAAAAATLAAMAAARAAAAAAGAVTAAASLSQQTSSLAHMQQQQQQQPSVAEPGFAQQPAAAQPAATWPGAARAGPPKTAPAAAPLAFPAYPAPAAMSSAAHVAFSDSQEADWDSHAVSEGAGQPGGCW